MKEYVAGSLMVGTVGLILPPTAMFANTGIPGAIIAAAMALCVWSGILGWARYADGASALVRLLPSLLLLLIWPGAGLVMMVGCRYSSCS
jgi:hypothetical protein